MDQATTRIALCAALTFLRKLHPTVLEMLTTDPECGCALACWTTVHDLEHYLRRVFAQTLGTHPLPTWAHANLASAAAECAAVLCNEHYFG